jgi:hypothetical protein
MLEPPKPQPETDTTENTSSNTASNSLEFINLLSSYKPSATASNADSIQRNGFPDVNLGALQGQESGKHKESPANGGKDMPADVAAAPPADAVPPPGPRPAPGPRPMRAGDGTTKDKKDEKEPEVTPEEHRKRIDDVDKELGKKLDPVVRQDIDKAVENLQSNKFADRTKAKADLEKLLETGGTAALAHVVKAHSETKDLEAKRRLAEAIQPQVEKELAKMTFNDWKGQQKTGDDPKAGLPDVFKQLTKTPAEQSDQLNRLEVLSAFTSLTNSSGSEGMKGRLAEQKQLKEIGEYANKLEGVHGRSLTDSDLATLAKVAPNLVALNIEKSPAITDKGIAALKGLSNLEHLGISHASLSDKAVNEISSMGQLQSLSLTLAQLDDNKLKTLSGLPNLNHLDVTDNPKVTDAGLVHLQNLQKLDSLTLDRTGISEKFLDKLPGLAELNSLSVKGTKINADSFDAKQVADKMPGLRHLSVGDQMPEDKLDQLREKLNSKDKPKITVSRDGGGGYY